MLGIARKCLTVLFCQCRKYFMHDAIEISQMAIPYFRNNSTSEVGAEEMSSPMTYGIFFPSQVLETFSEVLTITNNFSPSLVQHSLYEIRELGQKIVTVDKKIDFFQRYYPRGFN